MPNARPSAPITPLTYTSSQAAERIGGSCTATWLKAQARDGKIPYLFIGGAYHFTADHITEALARFEHRPREQELPARPATARTPRPRAAAPAPARDKTVTVLTARLPRTARGRAAGGGTP
jgi:hypothetical protein